MACVAAPFVILQADLSKVLPPPNLASSHDPIPLLSRDYLSVRTIVHGGLSLNGGWINEGVRHPNFSLISHKSRL